MFGKLKNKLKDWTKNLSKKAEEIQELEETQEVVLKPKEQEKIKEKKSKADKKAEKEKKKKDAKEKKLSKKKEKQERKSKKEEIKDIKIPKKFNVGTQKVEPDLEKVPEIIKKIHKEIESLPEKQDKKTVIEVLENIQEKEQQEKEQQEKEQQEKKPFFQKLGVKISKVKISEQDFDVYAEELEMLLIENNVALEVAEKMIKQLREEIVGKEMLKKEIQGQIQESFKDIIRNILIKPFDLIEKIKNFKKDPENKDEPYVILFCGVNGTGKTTSIAKLAKSFKDNNLKPVLAAADTFRAASIEQIKKHASKLDLNVIAHEYGSDPAAVGFDAIKYAKKNKLDVVLIDTAGRMHTEKNLMAEIEKVARVTKPNTKIFVGESITGNDILEQVRSFDWAVQIDGIILSKADIDEKGGTALSVGYVTKKPILYLGTGQEYDKIQPFDKEKFLDKLGLNDED